MTHTVSRRRNYPTPPRKRSNKHSLARIARGTVGNAAMAYMTSGNPYKAALSGLGTLGRGFLARRAAANRRGGNYAAKGPGRYHKRSSVATGASFQGKFKRKRYARKVDAFRKYGFVHTSEINGSVSDPNCVYVGHSSMSGTSTLAVICQALVRKLFKIGAGWDCPSIDTAIKGYEGFADGWRLILTMRQYGTGVETAYTYDTTVTETIYTLVGDPANGLTGGFGNLFNFFYAYATAASLNSASTNVPVRLELYGKDGNVGTFWRHCAGINILNEVLHLRCKSEMKIQNRSLSNSGSDLAESVSNNPLVGRVYKFNTGAPRSGTEGVQFVETINDYTGVVTVRAAQFTAVTTMREPPPPSMFTNITSTGKIRLEPGAIKSDMITYSKRVNLLKFLDSWGFRVGPVVDGSKQIKLKGTSALFALEDVINVNSAQNILIAYEVNREFGCYLTSAAPNYAFGKLFQNTQDNLTP